MPRYLTAAQELLRSPTYFIPRLLSNHGLHHVRKYPTRVSTWSYSIILFFPSGTLRKLIKMSAEADVKLEDFKSIFSLDGKVAVVTGGSRGLGLHAASG